MNTTDTNRALEFLYQAHGAFPVLHDRWGWKAKQLVGLAIVEVQELLDRLAELEAQKSVNGVLVVGLFVGDGAEIATRQEKRL